MRLRDYLDTHEISPSAYAAKLGLPVSVITRLLRGERGVSLETAVRIELDTAGAVACRELLIEAQGAVS